MAKLADLFTTLGLFILFLAAIFMTISPGYGFEEYIPSYQAEVLANYAFSLISFGVLLSIASLSKDKTNI